MVPSFFFICRYAAYAARRDGKPTVPFFHGQNRFRPFSPAEASILYLRQRNTRRSIVLAYHNESTEEILRALGADPDTGLTGETAAARLAEHGENRLREKKKKSTLRRFLDQFKDVMILILLAAAAVSFGHRLHRRRPDGVFRAGADPG